uniref:Uncharacterized protein n=1 Tax=Zea mays TaxID=4577 RepID=C4J7E1_MAIZE|nr:unknown [Zea mays]
MGRKLSNKTYHTNPRGVLLVPNFRIPVTSPTAARK